MTMKLPMFWIPFVKMFPEECQMLTPPRGINRVWIFAPAIKNLRQELQDTFSVGYFLIIVHVSIIFS